jgi:AAA domain
LGQPTLGRSVNAGDVVYLFSEGTTGLSQRYKALVQHHGVSPLYFKAVPVSIDIANPGTTDTFIHAVEATGLKPGLVVIDTLSTNFGNQDENDTKAMVAFVRGCDRIRRHFPGSAVLVIHHIGKDAAKGLRGAYALTANVHTVMMLKAIGAAGRLVLSNTKQKDGAKFNEIHVRRVVVELDNDDSSCVIVTVDAPPAAERDGGGAEERNMAKALEVLRGLGSNGATSGEWRKASGWGRTTHDNVRRALLAAGKVTKQDKRYAIVPTLPEPCSERTNGQTAPSPLPMPASIPPSIGRGCGQAEGDINLRTGRG